MLEVTGKKLAHRVKNVLMKAKCLTEAERLLESISGEGNLPGHRASAWGLYDGYYARPFSFAGLVSYKNPQGKSVNKGCYEDGYAAGARLRKEIDA